MTEKSKAVFLDRDGVLIEDSHLLTDKADIRILPGVPEALERLKAANYKLVVVTNQTVIARGLASTEEVKAINHEINQRVGGMIDAFYLCPHHPQATLMEYRKDCQCRKPKPGMLFEGANDLQLELTDSWMIGDRISDIVAGQRAGCKTIQVMTGAHTQPAIQSTAMPEDPAEPDHQCLALGEAAQLILISGGPE